ncbi:hypothetical protein KQX54_016430 [Cotesia glomerata]|uniref:DUF7044 domain-containing protein n=1 Tax=Cotesia glomerata TaxID=32391 RepID=A0AAV7HF71_COTGL|nr:hypothetical protein KQX54_016430 [Cotesia glomerata]
MAVSVDNRLARSGRATVTAFALASTFPLALAVSTSTKFRSGELGATQKESTSYVTNRTLVFTRKLVRVSGSCQFPESWRGQWFQSGKPSSVTINATTFGEKTCIENNGDMYSVYDFFQNENCYKCLIINDRHKNVIQFREQPNCESMWGIFNAPMAITLFLPIEQRTYKGALGGSAGLNFSACLIFQMNPSDFPTRVHTHKTGACIHQSSFQPPSSPSWRASLRRAGGSKRDGYNWSRVVSSVILCNGEENAMNRDKLPTKLEHYKSNLKRECFANKRGYAFPCPISMGCVEWLYEHRLTRDQPIVVLAYRATLEYKQRI